jgi:putative protease
MKKSRPAASKKRTAAKSRKAAKPKKARASAAKRRTTKKVVTRTARKKPAAARKPARKPARAAKPKPKAKPAPKRRAATAIKKKPATARVARVPKVAPVVAPPVPANELKVGVVTHYYSHLSVAVVSLTDRGLRVGDRIHIKGHTSDFYQSVESLQLEHESVMAAGIGPAVGMKVTEHAREHDVVYIVT